MKILKTSNKKNVPNRIVLLGMYKNVHLLKHCFPSFFPIPLNQPNVRFFDEIFVIYSNERWSFFLKIYCVKILMTIKFWVGFFFNQPPFPSVHSTQKIKIRKLFVHFLKIIPWIIRFYLHFLKTVYLVLSFRCCV